MADVDRKYSCERGAGVGGRRVEMHRALARVRADYGQLVRGSNH